MSEKMCAAAYLQKVERLAEKRAKNPALILENDHMPIRERHAEQADHKVRDLQQL